MTVSPAASRTAASRTGASRTGASLDVERLRRDFPILEQRIGGHPLAFFDSAASAQRPERVLTAVDRCYREYYANVHRGVHTLSQRSSEAYEAARDRVQRMLGAAHSDEIVFLRGTTEGINLVAQSYGREHVDAGDEVLITHMEHHSNIVPWQQLCRERGATLRVVPVDDDGNLILEELEAMLSERTRIVAVVHISNTLGTLNPIREISELAHRVGAVVVVDGAQSVPHIRVDVGELGCDFFAFSGHKAYGPAGASALYGRRELLAAMPPWQSGGGMIRSVQLTESLFADPPHRFEAGTPNIAGTIGMASAFDYLESVGFEALRQHEERLMEQTIAGLAEIPRVRILGAPEQRVGVLSFVVDGVHAHDVGTFLDQEGIAVRVGHHCTQPLMDRFGVEATTRASFALFNDESEVDRLLAAVRGAVEFFG